MTANHPNRSKTPGPYSNPKPEAIIEARSKALLTQAAAAKLVRVSTITWKKWEAGEYRMPAGLWELFLIKIDDKNREITK